jgi:hypothetical protein
MKTIPPSIRCRFCETQRSLRLCVNQINAKTQRAQRIAEEEQQIDYPRLLDEPSASPALAEAILDSRSLSFVIPKEINNYSVS